MFQLNGHLYFSVQLNCMSVIDDLDGNLLLGDGAMCSEGTNTVPPGPKICEMILTNHLFNLFVSVSGRAVEITQPPFQKAPSSALGRRLFG